MSPSLGIKLERLCQSAVDVLILAAPFIKKTTLTRLINAVPSSVKICCITRWRPDEIALGVSDIDIWLLLKDRQNMQLFLRSDLHAKYYRADAQCLVGSANLTNTALGWSKRPNLELLISASSDDLSIFEEEMLKGCVTVDDSIYEHMKSVVENISITRIIEQVPQDETPEDYADEINIMPAEAWLPTLRHPEKLYVAYQGGLEELGTGSRIAALSDLQALDIPKGLSEEDFNTYVDALLLQKPIIQRIDQFVVESQRFGAVRDLLSTLPCAKVNPDFDASIAWQTTMRWLLFFVRNRYDIQQPNISEVFYRKEL